MSQCHILSINHVLHVVHLSSLGGLHIPKEHFTTMSWTKLEGKQSELWAKKGNGSFDIVSIVTKLSTTEKIR